MPRTITIVAYFGGEPDDDVAIQSIYEELSDIDEIPSGDTISMNFIMS